MNQTEGIKGLFIQKSRGHRLIATYLLNQFDNVNNKPSLQQFSDLSTHILRAGMIKEHIDKMLTFNVSQIRDGMNRTILHGLAGVKGSTRILEVYIKEFEIVDINDKSNYPPSFHAALNGNIGNLELLIINGADVNYVNNMYRQSTSPTEIDSSNTDNSLSFIVAEIGNAEVAKILLDNGAKFDNVNMFGRKPVDVAAKYGHIELVEILINHGVKADHVALHHAAARNHTQIVEYLLKTGNVRDICLPCTPGNISSCYTSRNISVHQTHLCFCETALYAAVSRGYTQIVKLLLRYGNESLECKHYSGKTPLMDAVERNDRNMVEFLLTNGADVNVQCTNEMSFNKLGFLGYECFFREFYANTDEKNFPYTSYCDRPVCCNGMGITHMCAREGLWEMIEYLVSTWNANLIALDNFHLSIVDYAAIHDNADFIRMFRATYPLESSILYKLSYVLGEKQMLRKIVACGSIETLRLFYSENNIKSFSENYNEGRTLLHLATNWSPYPRPPDGLEEKDSNYREISSCTDILNYNCYFRQTRGRNYFPDKELEREYEKRLKVVKLLTKCIGNIDSKDAYGRTALHYAALRGFFDAVRHLVREGSDWKIKDRNWFTPLHLALEAVPRDSICRFDFFRTPNCQNKKNANYFQSCKSTVYDHTVSYLIRLYNTSLNECNKETKDILKSIISKKLHLSLYSLFENGVKVNCGGGLKTYLKNHNLDMI